MSSRRQGPNFHHNHLIHEKSPYLLQHAENPVDWYPWGAEAFQKAREEGKPVFLSIGYATCHWCHVMAHESFEDEEVSDLLNESFVAIKVDREERPDIDHLYMFVCQGLTGQGGWPLSIFMTPEGNPFFAGTYFPKSGRMGMTGFTGLLTQIANLWKNNREKLLKSGEGIRQALQQQEAGTEKGGPALDQKALQKAYIQLSRAFDPVWGGFGQAPKFPTPHQMNFLLRWGKRSGDSQAALMVEKTLQAMRQGGIFDQIGLGFHRYSVDEKWLVPHFEKMLYDQAMLAMSYLEAYQALGKSDYAETAREIFTYVLRDMTSPEGGFYSAEDADSENREGLFYVWTPREIQKHLGEDLGNLFCRFYDITHGGNFEDGTSIPHISRPLAAFAQTEKIPLPELTRALEEGRERLFAVREKRIHPLKDDKIITSWNGLMIAALAKGYQALQDPAYARAAKKAADFILGQMVKDGRLMRRFRHRHIAHPGFLDDYAFFIWGLLELYEAT
ncbi:MAG: thioredoxin domain-containing protein, partial [Deltaproteobacteria bacterium]|nr:thioredoxin domain-containing protein [Deltaproteobacteria bacterium]